MEPQPLEASAPTASSRPVEDDSSPRTKLRGLLQSALSEEELRDVRDHHLQVLVTKELTTQEALRRAEADDLAGPERKDLPPLLVKTLLRRFVGPAAAEQQPAAGLSPRWPHLPGLTARSLDRCYK